MIHLYAFVHGLRALPERPGLGGGQAESYPFGSVVAVVENVESRSDDTAAAIAHGLVVESLVDCADAVVPARFGRPFASRAALADVTLPKLPELRRDLLRVRGCVELSVRIAEPQQRETELDGAGYLRGLAAETARRDACTDEVHGALVPLALDCRVDRFVHGGAHFRGAYLVRRDDLAPFAERVDAVAGRRPEVSVLCTGPWAPYSFVGEAA